MIASVSVSSATPTVVLPQPETGSYRFIAIGNVGSSTAYLKFTADPAPLTASNGIPLQPGAAILCDQDEERDIFKVAVTAVTADGETTTLSAQAY